MVWSIGLKPGRVPVASKTEPGKATWFGIDSLARDPKDSYRTSIRIADLDGDDVPDLIPLVNGEYVLNDPSLLADYDYDYNQYDTGETEEIYRRSWSKKKWYGKRTYYVRTINETPFKKIHTHSMPADIPVQIDFIGFDESGVDVQSQGDILINFSIQNRNGDTTITSFGGAIQSINDAAVISGRNINLNAVSGIDGVAPIKTNLIDGDEGVLNAVTISGNINIEEVSGSLFVDNVTTQSGDVRLSTLLNIFRRDGADAGSDTLIRGGIIDLTAQFGAVGTPLSRF